MKKNILLLFSFISAAASYAFPPKYDLTIAPGTITENSVTLLWNKQYGKESMVYQIFLDGKIIGTTSKTNYTINKLSAATRYSVGIAIQQKKKQDGNDSHFVQFTTSPKSKFYNILDYGAKDDAITTNTKAIQSAIDAYSAGGSNRDTAPLFCNERQ